MPLWKMIGGQKPTIHVGADIPVQDDRGKLMRAVAASAEGARTAIDIGASRWINIKYGRVGGLTNALKVHKLCTDRKIPCWTRSNC